MACIISMPRLSFYTKHIVKSCCNVQPDTSEKGFEKMSNTLDDVTGKKAM